MSTTTTTVNDAEALIQGKVQTGTDTWPSQTKYILGNEAAERFSYYGMKGILALYITGILMMTRDQATYIIHLFGFANYFMPLLGAWISDRYWGRYKTILWISLSYCAGHGVLACSDLFNTVDGKILCLYGGLALIAFGSGGIKPCVAAFMGDQFKAEQKHLLQKAYAAFYWMINLGSTAAFLIIPWVRDSHGYSWAFGVPGIAMAIATLIFWMGTKKYVHVAPSAKTRSSGFMAVLMYSIRNRAQRKPGEKFWDVARSQFTDAEVDAAKSVGPILGIFSLIPIFWALFDQTFSTWVLQGEKMTPYMLGNYKIGPEQMLAANPIMVMTLIPIMTLYLYPILGKYSSPLRRMAYGMFMAALSFVMVAWLQVKVDSGAQMSIMWQTLPYIVLTMSEVLVSTTGLEFAFREAAPSMKSTIMGFWNLTVAIGNLLVGLITIMAVKALGSRAPAGSASIAPSTFMFYAGVTFVVAIVFCVAAAFYKYRDASAAEGK
jgi:proton-dependent oligopeptide transporter, POT family